MDHTLTREESLRLMELLQLPMEQYGNFPLMRKAFLARCRVLHPDKGGDQTLAKELITLYRKLEEHLPQLDPQERFSTDQVCVGDPGIKFMKDWLDCNQNLGNCTCLFCLLRDDHNEKCKGARPKCWGQCLCFKCYITWFGLEHNWEIFLSWRGIVGLMPFCALNI
ncbi:small T antigen [Betapolyomavirus mastomysis]|uniref:Small T antigen n=1 Tax=Betapolyomavirus mastomysis TaxID=1891768 RepID=E5RUP5_9POLY|nr:small T antigen [Betapolyomavirus mastomysis]BAJ53088.1 small T antigen [Betapolyomavirus mastomysis]